MFDIDTFGGGSNIGSWYAKFTYSQLDDPDVISEAPEPVTSGLVGLGLVGLGLLKRRSHQQRMSS